MKIKKMKLSIMIASLAILSLPIIAQDNGMLKDSMNQNAIRDPHYIMGKDSFNHNVWRHQNKIGLDSFNRMSVGAQNMLLEDYQNSYGKSYQNRMGMDSFNRMSNAAQNDLLSDYYNRRRMDPKAVKKMDIKDKMEMTNKQDKGVEPKFIPSTPNMEGWSQAAQAAATEAIGKYGNPDASSADNLLWISKGDWKTISISKMETKHNWPIPHTDMFEQCINYRVPTGKLADLAKFDGSVTFKRTEGLLCARCDKEAMNILALNIAVQIIDGKLEVAQARTKFTKNAMTFKNGEKPTITQKLLFKPDTSAPYSDNAADMMGMKSNK